MQLIPQEVAAIGRKSIEQFIDTQTELLEQLQESNRQWFERMQSEAALASEFANKMTAARSIPETATVFQEWSSRRMELAGDDAKHLLADTQKLIETGVRWWPNTWLPRGASGIAT